MIITKRGTVRAAEHKNAPPPNLFQEALYSTPKVGHRKQASPVASILSLSGMPPDIFAI